MSRTSEKLRENHVKIKNRRKISLKIAFKVFFTLIIVLPLPIFFYFYLTDYKQTPIAQTAWVSWYGNPSQEVYIAWETPEPSIGEVKLGIDLNNLNQSFFEPIEVRYHCINITGLMPNTQYFYQIRYNEKIYTEGKFKTAPTEIYNNINDNSTKSFDFIMFSDTQQKIGPGWHTRLAQEVAEETASFVAIVGDYVEDGKKYEWNDFFTRASPYLQKIPIVPIAGNHDRARNGDYPFGKYFRNSVGKGEQFYYSFNWSNVHFQILYFPQMDLDDGPEGFERDYNKAFTSEQFKWIEEDLARSQDKDFRITFFHCPITGAGFYGPNYVLKEEVLPILQKYNVSISVHGHAHHYERGVIENPINPEYPLTFFDVGTGGGLIDVALRPVNETIFASVSPAYVKVHVENNKITFMAISLNKEILDEYELIKPNLKEVNN